MNGDHGDTNRYTGDARNVIQSHHIGAVNIHHPPAAEREPPRFLPPRPVPFANRDAELDRLSVAAGAERPAGSPAVVIISGLRGVGKTATALRWAYQERDRFPDGELYVDFHGLGHREVTGPGAAIGVLLRGLGVAADQVPTGHEESRLHYRRRVAGRRVFLLLDNVRLAAQVENLIPPSEHAVVIITTGSDLTGLAGRFDAEMLRLGELDEEASLRLLTALVDARRVERDGDGARELVRACGRWPMAIRLAAGRLKARPDRPIGTFVTRLRSAPEYLASVQVVSDATYEEMPAELRRAYRRVGLHPGGDRPSGAARGTTISFRPGAAAALIGCTEDEAVDLLDSLTDRHLLDGDGERYVMHDLVREHARGRTEDEDDERDRDAAVRRVIEWYLLNAVRADRDVNPDRAKDAFGAAYRRAEGAERTEATEGTAMTEREALAWLDGERRNLRFAVHAAADRRRDDLVWQLCEALWGLYFSLKHYDDWVATHELGLTSARRLDDPKAVFRMGVQLGRARFELREFDRAHVVLAEALAAAERIGDPLHQATALEFIGRAHLDAGDPDAALSYFRRSHDLERAGGRTRGVAINLHHMARARLARGETIEATRALEQAEEMFTGLRDDYNRARVLTTVGRVRLAGDEPDSALAALSEAVRVMEAQGRLYQVGEILETMSEATRRAGDAEKAVRLRDAAISAYDRGGSVRAYELRGS